jgi:tRNA (guanine10-N2)-dimethyltransferase
MEYVFLLSKEDIPLARLELEALFGQGIRHYECISLLSARHSSLYKRPAYTRAVFRHLFSCKLGEVGQRMESYDWASCYRKSFSVRIHGSSDLSERELAGFIWRSVKRPRVDLNNAHTKVTLFVQGSRVHAGLLLHRNDSDYESRKAHRRPRLHPSSMHPKLARAMVNLTGIRRGTIHDPFCGSGGILIEAGLMDLSAVGYDIDQRLIDYADDNLRHYRVRHARLALKDSTLLKQGMRYVVTDLPYGRNTRKDSRLYRNFFSVLDKCLVRSAVIGLPSTVDFRRLVKRTGLRLVASHICYVHSSLSKRIIVLSAG